mgnify:FL=1
MRPVLDRDSTNAVRLPMRFTDGFGAVASKIFGRLRPEQGTAIEDVARGLPWLSWAERPAVPMIEIEGEVRIALTALADVEVMSVSARRISGRIRIDVRVRVQTSDSMAVLTVAVADPYLTDGPPLWFQVTALS